MQRKGVTVCNIGGRGAQPHPPKFDANVATVDFGLHGACYHVFIQNPTAQPEISYMKLYRHTVSAYNRPTEMIEMSYVP